MKHGYVTPNPGGWLARCGGPGDCDECNRELAERSAAKPKAPEPRHELQVTPQARDSRPPAVRDAERAVNCRLPGFSMTLPNVDVESDIKKTAQFYVDEYRGK